MSQTESLLDPAREIFERPKLALPEAWEESRDGQKTRLTLTEASVLWIPLAEKGR